MNKRTKNIMICLLAVLVICAGAVAFISLNHKETQDSSAVPENESSNFITYQGKKYKYNSDIKTILFLGVDKGETVDVAGTPGQNGQSDTLLLLVMNTETKTADILEISRDTVTEIDICDISGEHLATEKAQIALQYAFGNSTKKSCQLVKAAVSHLLYEVPVRAHIAMGIDGVGPVVDAIGGVKITVPEDYTEIDPAFQKGARLTLNGEQAERYIRYRDTSVVGSNQERMKRQNEFLMAMMEQFKGMDSTEGYQLLEGSAGEYIDTDLTADEIKELSEYQISNEIIKLPGEEQKGEDYDEFHIDNVKLYEIVLKMFYKSVD